MRQSFLNTGSEVDWWALGCMTYEFLVGITPFYGETCEEIFENIMNNSTALPLSFFLCRDSTSSFKTDILWPEPPDSLSPDAQSLIAQLLVTDPAKRLGSKGAAEVKAHPFFQVCCYFILI